MKNKKKYKSLIVSPYLDHLGGGERYMLEIAKILEGSGHELSIAWNNSEQIVHLAKKQGIKLSPPKLDPQIIKLYFQGSPFKMLKATKKYDYIFYLSDGSIPFLGGKNNIIHFQVPFQGVNGKSPFNKIKLSKISNIIVNSSFTKKFIDQEYGVKSQIIYPPVDLLNKSTKKQNIILSVGRFEASLNVKKQNVLIDAFKEFSPQHKNWKLILAGAAKDKSMEYIDLLKKETKGHRIEFAANISHNELRKLYGDAAIYWHAAGFGENEQKNPELTEHFGMTTVEAVSAGCIPLIVPKGGQKEIIKNSQFHWSTTKNLVNKTSEIIKNLSEYQKLSSSIPINQFSTTNFKQKIKEILQ